jgi:flagellar hook protein FlgE
MSSAISIGTTGLTASAKEMDVISNNLANSNTLGFKASQTYFASMLNQSLSSAGSMAVGQGVGVAAVQTDFTQGAFQTTTNPTDLAIDGDGFFQVKDKSGASLYTRAGNFHIDNAGYMVDVNNFKVQGKTGDLNQFNVPSPPVISTMFSIGANLDDAADYGDTFHVIQPVFDTKGNSLNMTITFQKTEGTGTWGFNASLDDNKGTITSASLPTASGLVFDSNGKLASMYSGVVPPAGIVATSSGGGTIASTTVDKPGQLYQTTGAPITLTKTAAGWTVTANGGYTNAVATQATVGANEHLQVDLDGQGGTDINFDLGATAGNKWAANDTVAFGITTTPVTTRDVTMTFTGAPVPTLLWDFTSPDALNITGYASTSVIQSQSADGYGLGQLKSISIDKKGVINGIFTNGQTQDLGQIELTTFYNVSGLKKIGNYFAQTPDSGVALTNDAGSNGLGEIISQSLEASNADIAKEFVNMIQAQRAYQSSAKAITTSDQMLTVLMNIKQ